MPLRTGLIYAATLAIMMGLDAAFLGLVAVPHFKATLGDLLLEKIRVAPALLFYLVYAAGVLAFVSLPATQPIARIALRGAAFGFVAYATYDFTNYATLRPWTLQLVLMDLVWGSFATAIAASGGAVAGLALTRLFGAAATGNG